MFDDDGGDGDHDAYTRENNKDKIMAAFFRNDLADQLFV